ncbi:histidinol-phosphatase HisJ family protein [Clostridium sp.]|uniref:histidinol-phosphatase HisJ family protein n=1 Tax=Clostridium sp. TaxID=1506 RepID=UPI00260CA162|nr:histidinol-phosphatase HisJ family protein [uncultured Clostridium sp.]
MNITDHHVHTEFSGDCDTPMEVIINKAKELGLKEVMFTDHMDFDYPSKDINFEVDYKKYLNVLEKLRIKYKEMDILMGIEVGYQPGLNESINKLLNSYDFDFVICSIHAWNGYQIIVTEDHGMNSDCNHGGIEDDERHVPLWTIGEQFVAADCYIEIDLISKH